MRRLILAAAAIGLACAHGANRVEKTRCPESQNLMCLTAPDCSMDDARGCMVCHCSTGGVDQGRPENYGTSNPPRDRP